MTQLPNNPVNPNEQPVAPASPPEAAVAAPIENAAPMPEQQVGTPPMPEQQIDAPLMPEQEAVVEEQPNPNNWMADYEEKFGVDPRTEAPSGLDWQSNLDEYMPGISRAEAYARQNLINHGKENPDIAQDLALSQEAYNRNSKLGRLRGAVIRKNAPAVEAPAMTGQAPKLAAKDEKGYNVASRSEAAELERAYNDNLSMYALGAMLNNPELFEGVDEKVAKVSPGGILSQSGWTDEQLDEHRARWFQQRGYALPEESRELYTGVASDEELAKRSKSHLADQARDAREIYSSIGMGFYDHTHEDLKEYASSVLGDDPDLDKYVREQQLRIYKEAYYDQYGVNMPQEIIDQIPTEGLMTAEALADMATSRTHADILLAHELSRRQFYIEGDEAAGFIGLKREMELNPEDWDDADRYAYGYAASFGRSFVNAAKGTPGAMASLGAMMLKGYAGLVPGGTESEFVSNLDDYVEVTAEQHHLMHLAHHIENSKFIRQLRVESILVK